MGCSILLVVDPIDTMPNSCAFTAYFVGVGQKTRRLWGIIMGGNSPLVVILLSYGGLAVRTIRPYPISWERGVNIRASWVVCVNWVVWVFWVVCL